MTRLKCERGEIQWDEKEGRETLETEQIQNVLSPVCVVVGGGDENKRGLETCEWKNKTKRVSHTAKKKTSCRVALYFSVKHT